MGIWGDHHLENTHRDRGTGFMQKPTIIWSKNPWDILLNLPPLALFYEFKFTLSILDQLGMLQSLGEKLFAYFMNSEKFCGNVERP